jgi:ASC-1-like (ASCH) protein
MMHIFAVVIFKNAFYYLLFLECNIYIVSKLYIEIMTAIMFVVLIIAIILLAILIASACNAPGLKSLGESVKEMFGAGAAVFGGSESNESVSEMYGGDSDGYKPERGLYIHSPWLEAIEAGTKTTEGRLGKDGEYKDWIGKDAIFWNVNQKVPVKIVKVVHYNTLDEYLDGEGWEKCAPPPIATDKKSAAAKYLSITMGGKGKTQPKQVFSPERVTNRGGINAIRIEKMTGSELPGPKAKKSKSKRKSAKSHTAV